MFINTQRKLLVEKWLQLLAMELRHKADVLELGDKAFHRVRRARSIIKLIFVSYDFKPKWVHINK
jgi:hypothetical protein